MKKIKMTTHIILAVVYILFAAQAYAAAQNAASEARVEFEPGTGPTNPVHPEDPNTEGNGGVEGSFAIVSVSDLDFGALQVSATTQSFDSVTIMPNIQVVDLRGTEAGWRVTASVSRFSNGTVDTLPGSSIHITDGRPNSLSVSTAPEQHINTVLTTDNTPVPVVTAAPGGGGGLWVMRWYPATAGTYVKLDIPIGTAAVGRHTATINWILQDTPSQ